jgi:hypothetical protein
MTEEKVTLYGGPRDSEVLEWRGGDTAEFPVYERMVVGYNFAAPNKPEPLKTALYRRSLRNRSIFVYQP